MSEHPLWVREMLTSKLWQRQLALVCVGVLLGWWFVELVKWVFS